MRFVPIFLKPIDQNLHSSLICTLHIKDKAKLMLTTKPPCIKFAIEGEATATSSSSNLPLMPKELANALIPWNLNESETHLQLGPCENDYDNSLYGAEVGAQSYPSYDTFAYEKPSKRHEKNNITQGPQRFISRQMASIEQSLRPRDIGHRFAYKITEEVDCIDVPKRSEFCDRLDALLDEFVQEIADTKPVPADEVLAKKRKIELRHQKQKELEHHHKNTEKQIESDGINTRETCNSNGDDQQQQSVPTSTSDELKQVMQSVSNASEDISGVYPVLGDEATLRLKAFLKILPKTTNDRS